MKGIEMVLLWLLAGTPALEATPPSTVKIAQCKEHWFSKGDMYHWKNKTAKLKVIVQTDGLWNYLEGWDSLQVIRDDSVFEARVFKEGREWFPTYKVDKNYLRRIDDGYIKGWLEQTNRWLSYLSGNKFKLELEGIVRVPEDSLWWHIGKVYTMIIAPHGGAVGGRGGWYAGSGVSFINPLDFYWSPKDSLSYSPASIHEILHSLLGPDHSPDTLSTAYYHAHYIGLTAEEAAFLGWPKVKPVRLKRIKF